MKAGYNQNHSFVSKTTLGLNCDIIETGSIITDLPLNGKIKIWGNKTTPVPVKTCIETICFAKRLDQIVSYQALSTTKLNNKVNAFSHNLCHFSMQNIRPKYRYSTQGQGELFWYFLIGSYKK